MVNRQKIMIVDDDENIAELISLYLTKECFNTRIVHDGESAMREFDTYGPNLILLDLMLPGMDGYQVCRELRQRSSVPIIILSAKGEVFDKVLGLELGADDYMIKPFDSKELVARVKAVLRRFQPEKSSSSQNSGKIVEYPDSWLLHQTRFSQENSCWITSGAMNTSAIPVRLTYISNVSGKRSKEMIPGH